MRRLWSTVGLIVAGTLCSAQSVSSTASSTIPTSTHSSGKLRGFQASEVAEEQRLEKLARAIPDPERLRKYMKFMAADPHQAGSARSKVVAEYILGQFREWGLQAQIEEFQALMPYPTVRRVQVIGPEPFEAKLKEPVVPQDEDSGDTGQLPTYNAYSASGDVTGQVVYANYGVPEDYEWLDKHGISVRGKVVLTRYGKSWRGIKPKVAAEHGAIACLIFSDPHEDGYFQDEAFPQGPMRPADGVQRGSVLDMPFYPGDPLTPGWASEKGARQLSRAEAKTLMTIPVLPISYADATPILRQLKGHVAPTEWRGALPFTYHVGPGETQVHMQTDYDWTSKPLYDVVATIPGSQFPDEWVLVGNHHDAWVNGADDPVSGTVALLETARALATLCKSGWTPKRTIKFAAWDGEEFGLLGSTEWAEKHQDELKKKAVAYLNSDSNGRGWLHVSGSHTLEQFAGEVAESVAQPDGTQTLAEYAIHHPVTDDPEETTPSKKDAKQFTIGALGAGSDYVVFLDYLGVACTNAGFGGAGKSGIYHSIYDSIYWYTHFSDGTFVHGKALSQWTTTAMLRLVDTSVLPFEFSHWATTVNGYVDEIDRDATKSGKKLDFTGIRKQIATLTANAAKYDSFVEQAIVRSNLDSKHLAALNHDLMQSERVLTRPEGLPNRWWYKHQIYAPGFYTGYGVKTLPGIREAVDSKDWALAQKEVLVVESVLENFNQVVVQAIAEAQGL